MQTSKESKGSVQPPYTLGRTLLPPPHLRTALVGSGLVSSSTFFYEREYSVRIGEGENADKPLFQADGVILPDILAQLRWGRLALLPEVDTY